MKLGIIMATILFVVLLKESNPSNIRYLILDAAHIIALPTPHEGRVMAAYKAIDKF